VQGETLCTGILKLDVTTLMAILVQSVMMKRVPTFALLDFVSGLRGRGDGRGAGALTASLSRSCSSSMCSLEVNVM